MRKLGCETSRVHVNPAGVDLSRIKSMTPIEKQHDGCFLGRITPSKGVLDLIKIWSNVVAVIPYVKACDYWRRRNCVTYR